MKKWAPSLAMAVTMLAISTPAYAEVGNAGYVGLGAGIAMGFAVLGGGLGQGMAARGMYESVSRNPAAAGKLNTPFFVGMAFIESLVLFAFAVAMYAMIFGPKAV